MGNLKSHMWFAFVAYIILLLDRNALENEEKMKEDEWAGIHVKSVLRSLFWNKSMQI